MPVPRPQPPLDRDRLLAALAARGTTRFEVRVLDSTVSTNADVLAAARSGAAEGYVVVAGEQRGGRGRRERSWASPPGSLSLSVLLRPDAPAPAWGWLPLLAGVAVVRALREVVPVAGFEPRLKWPNDVVVASGRAAVAMERKLAGILVERADAAGPVAVVGVGVNVGMAEAGLPVPAATSVLVAAGVEARREDIAAALLAELADGYRRWVDAGGDAAASGLHDDYLAVCATIGRRVGLQLPGSGSRTGTAVGVDAGGRLLLSEAGVLTAFSAGDVVHLRAPQ